MKKIILGCFLVLSVSLSMAQVKTKGAIRGAIQHPAIQDTCYHSGISHPSSISNNNPRFLKSLERLRNRSNGRPFQNSLATSEIIINFSANFNNNPQARNAFRFAADMWEMEIVSSVPIVIDADFRELEGGTIASNGSNVVSNVPNAPDPTVFYVSSMGNAIAGEDLLPGQPDLIQTYNSSFNFYYGLDASPPPDQTDFVTIAFHEIGHGMGITGASNGGQGVGRGSGAFPNAWDTFVELSDGTPILDLPFGSDAQINALVGNGLFINSFGVKEVLNGSRAKIFAPVPFNPGSSFSHWDESTFPAGDPNSLMTPFNSSGEAIHDLGDITRGILRDMGWQLSSQEDFDLGVATINSPNSAQGLSNESVTIVVGNLGIQEVSNIPVSYRLNDGEWITENMPQTILPGQEVAYTFATPVDLSEAGQTYTITASVDILVDPNVSNNETFKSVTHFLPITSFPYNESFESGAAQWTVEGNQLWQLGTPSGAIINSAADGAAAWVTNLVGNYPDETTSFLVSPVFDFSGKQDPEISMDIWYDIEFAWDGVSLQSSTDNGSTWSTIGVFGDEVNWYTDGPDRTPASDGSEGDAGIDALTAAVMNGHGWTGTGSTGSGGYIRAERELTGLGGETVIFRLVFASDQASNNEGFAFDNVTIIANDQGTNDVGIVELVSPVSGALTSSESITVLVQNFGIAAASGFDISYQIDDGVIVTETFSASLAPGEAQQFTFSTTQNLSALQTYQVRVFASLPNDDVSGNDELIQQVQNLFTVTTFPYQESFEVDGGGWSSNGTNSSWELGIPSGSIINSASNGVNAWVTNTTGLHNSDESSYLISPGFNLSNLSRPALAFDLWSDVDLSDGLYLEASVDNGSTWVEVTSEDALNWTNTIISQQSVWSGSSEGYQTSFIELLSFAGEEFVLFRFVFESDEDIENEGFAIDNIRLSDLGNLSYSIECPADQALNTDAQEPFATVSISNPTISNGSGTVTITNTFTNNNNASSTYIAGETVVDFIVDVAGELAVCQTTITVTDNENPEIDCPGEIIVAVPSETTSTRVDYPLPQVSDNFGFLNQVTYSNNQTPDGQSGVACPTGPNSFIRAFDLENDFDIASGFSLRSVDVGIQSSTIAIPSKINIYTFDAVNLDINSSEDFVLSNFELLASTDFTFNANLTNALVNVPIAAEVPANQIVILEFFTELGTGDAGNPNFFPGANPDQEGRSYLLGPQCGIDEPADVTLVGDGFPNAQWVMNLNGFSTSNVEPTLTSGLGTGAIFPLGSSTESYTISDAQGNQASCDFDITVIEATLTAPVANSATGIGADQFNASWQAVSGVQFYQLFVSDDNFESFVDGYNGKVIEGVTELVTGLEKNTAYTYRVRSVNSSNPTEFSVFSNIITTSTLIDAPINLLAVEVSDVSFIATWQGITGIERYLIDVSADGFNTFVVGFESRTVVGNQIEVTGLEGNIEYSWRVRATNIGGESEPSSTATISTLPQTPLAETASSIETDGFDANWSDTGADSYEIDISIDNFQTFVPGFEGFEVNGNSLTVDNLDPNETYRYRVRSKLGSGVLSLNSNAIRATTGPEVPVALEPSTTSTYAFVAQWEESPNVNTYALDVTSDDFSELLPGFDNLLVFGNSILVGDLEPGTYSYRVRAVNANGVVSNNSNVINVVISDSDPEQPNVPVATAASDIGAVSFVANWESQPNAIFYQLQVSVDDFATLVQLPVENIFANSFLVEGLDDRTDYAYRVRAFNNIGKSDYSNVIELSTITGVEGEIARDVTVYPNPGNDKFIINLSSLNDGVASVSLIDLNGKSVIDLTDLEGVDSSIVELDLENVLSGIYTLRIETINGLIFKRVAKQ